MCGDSWIWNFFSLQCRLLTDTKCRHQSDGNVRRATVCIQGLKDVCSERHAGDGVASGYQHDQANPEEEEGREIPHWLHNISIVGTRGKDSRPELGIAHSTHQTDASSEPPHQDTGPDTARLQQNTFWRDEDAGAHDDTHDDSNAIEKAKLFLQHNFLTASVGHGDRLLMSCLYQISVPKTVEPACLLCF